MGKRKSEKPKAPDGLKGEALAEWSRVTAELEQLGRLNKVDRAVLATYCLVWATFTAASAEVAANGPVCTYSNGMTAVSPHYKILKEMAMRCESLLAALGLTPAARDFDPPVTTDLPDLEI